MHARVEDAIRTGKQTGIGKFPSHLLALNRAWLAAALTAATLLAWMPTLALDGDLAARLVHSGRRRHLKIAATWPWAPVIVAAWDRISALTPPP